MVDTKAVSVRLPLDLLNELNSYATDKGMVRGGDANIGGAIIAVLRERFFNESDNVKQVSDNVDIESIVNAAVEGRLEAILSQVESLRLDVHSVKTNDLITQNLQANLTVAQQRIEALEDTVTAKKPLLSVMRAQVAA
ncbi:MAG: hypothetical protein ACOYN8_17330 [Pseudanabaena sp.]|jgi:hypothetical protein